MDLKKVVSANVTHIAEQRYRNFTGTNLAIDESYIAKPAAKKKTPDEVRKAMISGYMKMLSNFN